TLRFLPRCAALLATGIAMPRVEQWPAVRPDADTCRLAVFKVAGLVHCQSLCDDEALHLVTEAAEGGHRHLIESTRIGFRVRKPPAVLTFTDVAINIVVPP